MTIVNMVGGQTNESPLESAALSKPYSAVLRAFWGNRYVETSNTDSGTYVSLGFRYESSNHSIYGKEMSDWSSNTTYMQYNVGVIASNMYRSFNTIKVNVSTSRTWRTYDLPIRYFTDYTPNITDSSIALLTDGEYRFTGYPFMRPASSIPSYTTMPNGSFSYIRPAGNNLVSITGKLTKNGSTIELSDVTTSDNSDTITIGIMDPTYKYAQWGVLFTSITR